MSIMIIPKGEQDAIKDLLTEAAAKRLEKEGVYTLAEYSSFSEFSGCIQFTLEEREEEVVGRLLYLLVKKKYQGTGVGEQLLLAMEESLKKSGIDQAVVTLPEDMSELGEYLEDYGFEMKVSDQACFVPVSALIARDAGFHEFREEIVRLEGLPDREVRRIYAAYQDIGTFHREDLDAKGSAVFSLANNTAMLLLRDRFGYPVPEILAPEKKTGLMYRRILLAFMAEQMTGDYPASTFLFFDHADDVERVRNCLDSPSDVSKAVEGILTLEMPERFEEKMTDGDWESEEYEEDSVDEEDFPEKE